MHAWVYIVYMYIVYIPQSHTLIAINAFPSREWSSFFSSVSGFILLFLSFRQWVYHPLYLSPFPLLYYALILSILLFHFLSFLSLSPPPSPSSPHFCYPLPLHSSSLSLSHPCHPSHLLIFAILSRSTPPLSLSLSLIPSIPLFSLSLLSSPAPLLSSSLLSLLSSTHAPLELEPRRGEGRWVSLITPCCSLIARCWSS